MTTIKQRSPSLWGELKRRFTPTELELLDSSFQSSIHSGGELELDFVRAEGDSFNPRLARIALILLQDAQVTDSNCIIEALNSAATAPNSEVALAAQAIFESPDGWQSDSHSQATLIALASHLDRARHIHLASADKQAVLLPDFLRKTDSMIAIARQTNERLYTLLSAWKTRVVNNISERTARVANAPDRS